MRLKKAKKDQNLAEQIPGESGDDTAAVAQLPRGWAGKRLVGLIAVVAVLALLAGVGIMQFIVSPAELASRTAPPEAGPVTAAIEEKVIENTIIARGEVTYADALDVNITAGSEEGASIVTGQVPKVGDVFKAGDVALEVSGRPVIVLSGDLPAYRNLSIGMRGPDVKQLKAALSALGYSPGDTSSNLFQWDTATAIGALYDDLGYSAPGGGNEADAAVRSAQAAVRSAEVGLTQARAALREADQQSGDPDLTVQYAEVDAAEDAVSDANDALESAQEAALPTMPLGEALFLASLPRRVDAINLKRGDSVTNPAMSVSGATLTIVGTLSKQDADLLKKDMKATYPLPNGDEKEATIKKIESPKAASKDNSENGDGEDGGGDTGSDTDRYTVSFDPGKLSSEEIDELRGTNVRVKIPVASTDGKVLAVPLAALSAGADGSNRVELLAPTKSDPYHTEIVDVTAGLAADGFVEISSDDPRIAVDAKVVVGR